MATATAPFPGRPFQLRCIANYAGNDIPGNRSLFRHELWIDKLSTSPTFDNNNVASWTMNYYGQVVASWGPGPFDFRNGNNFLLTSGERWISNAPDGAGPEASIYGWANYGALGIAQTPTLYIAAPRIPRGPRVNDGSDWRYTVAYVNDGTDWRIAIPYVNVNGVWRIGGG